MRHHLTNLLLALFLAAGVSATSPALAGERGEVTLYKLPQCGCCEGHADYLRGHGFEVGIHETEDVVEMSRKAGIPDEYQGCHLAFIDGYVVSGHVPVATIERMLAERPAIKGIALPGMPLGSPGMSGDKQEPFTIYAVGGDARAVYAVE